MPDEPSERLRRLREQHQTQGPQEASVTTGEELDFAKRQAQHQREMEALAKAPSDDTRERLRNFVFRMSRGKRGRR